MDQPGGISGPSIAIPWGTRIPRPMTSAPIRVSFAISAAVGAENTSGANSSQTPTPPIAQPAHIRPWNASHANATSTAALARSLTDRARLSYAPIRDVVGLLRPGGCNLPDEGISELSALPLSVIDIPGAAGPSSPARSRIVDDQVTSS